ncbi:UNVERIFIED_CONTAM: Solute carrier 26, partial [Siphonaria sp. JEL0065]
MWTRLRYYVPVLTWLPVYTLSQFPLDALAGLSVACLLVPQGLSYAQAILHIPPVYGLYTCITPLLVYSILGTSRQLDPILGGLKAPQWPVITLPRVRYYILSAILIAVIGFVESIVIGKTYASKYNYSVSPNRELVALGVANIVGSFFGGWPAFGSLGRSVNDAAGGRSQISGFITCIVVLVTTVYLLPLFYFLPKAVCSSIIVVAATKLIELHDIQFILQVRAWNDLGLLLLTFFTTLFVSIEVGTLISVGTSLLLVIKHTTKTRIAILGRTLIPDPTTRTFKPKFRPLSEKIEEGLFFGNSGQLKDRLKRIELFGDLSVHPGEAPRRPGGVGSPSRLTEGSISLFSGNSSLRLPAERRRSRSRSADSQCRGSRSPSTSPCNVDHRDESEDLDEFDELLEEEENVAVRSPSDMNGSDLASSLMSGLSRQLTQ